MVNANTTPHGYETSDRPSRNPAATWCTDATPAVIGPVAGCLQRLPGDGHVVTEDEPETDGAGAPDPPNLRGQRLFAAHQLRHAD
jgi:hypothetical protein